MAQNDLPDCLSRNLGRGLRCDRGPSFPERHVLPLPKVVPVRARRPRPSTQLSFVPDSPERVSEGPRNQRARKDEEFAKECTQSRQTDLERGWLGGLLDRRSGNGWQPLRKKITLQEQ